VEDEDAEQRVAFERIRAAELDEEARRHFSVDNEALEARPDPDEEDPNARIQAVDPDEERAPRHPEEGEEDDEPSSESELEEAESETTEGENDDGFGPGSASGGFATERLGDPNLVHPDEIRRVLGPAVRFAQHAMILTERRMQQGATRDEALAFMMGLYVGVSDREYARRALRDFGPATGIVDIYPLELVDQLLSHVPSFFRKVRRGPVFEGPCPSDLVANVPVALRVPDGVRIRGFALKGGPRPGYAFEPAEPGYRLVIQSEGTFEVMVSAITRDGWLQVDSWSCRVADNPDDPEREANTSARYRRLWGQEEPSADESRRNRKRTEDLTIHFPRRV
jgi:hypothetical protein